MRFQGKPGSLQLSLRFRDTRLLGSTTTTNNLMVESKYRINPQKGDSRAHPSKDSKRDAGEGRSFSLGAHSTPNIPASISHTPGAFTSTHPQLHSPPTVQKQGAALQRESKMQEQPREKKKGRTDGKGPRKADRIKLETRILDEEDQGKSRTSIR